MRANSGQILVKITRSGVIARQIQEYVVRVLGLRQTFVGLPSSPYG